MVRLKRCVAGSRKIASALQARVVAPAAARPPPRRFQRRYPPLPGVRARKLVPSRATGVDNRPATFTTHTCDSLTRRPVANSLRCVRPLCRVIRNRRCVRPPRPPPPPRREQPTWLSRRLCPRLRPALRRHRPRCRVRRAIARSPRGRAVRAPPTVIGRVRRHKSMARTAEDACASLRRLLTI